MTIITIASSFFLNLFLLYAFFSSLSESHVLQHRHIVQLNSLFPSSICNPSTKGTLHKRSSLKVVHKDGPCSKFNKNKPNAPINFTQILLQDQSRVDFLNLRHLKSTSKNLYDLAATVPVKPEGMAHSGNYIVTVGLGTPKVDLTLAFDTGSGITWTQCEPCQLYCYKQNDPIFAPSKSTSYTNISCTSEICLKLKTSTGITPRCAVGACNYAVRYLDESFSTGIFAKETITLGSTLDVFENFNFGCGQDNEGIFGTSSGILGLDRDELSFVSQSAQKYEKTFTYCLPSTSSSTGHLTFGKSGNIIPTTTKFTPLVNSLSQSYSVTILGISVDGTRLPISPSIFSNVGSIIDSGTVITRLPLTAYGALRSAYRQSMSKYPLTNPVLILDTCYDLSAYDVVTLPKISFFFGGDVEMVLDPTGTIYSTSKSQVCLAFAGNKDDISRQTIFGNIQQLTYDIVYDVSGGRIGFSPGGCV